VSIHREHPFLPPEDERDPLRRFRGRMPQPVSLWCAQDGDRRAGWTVSSLLVADGQSPEVLGLVDEDSDVAELAERTGRVAISLLRAGHQQLADAFAGQAPAPGGPFRQAEWTDSRWGPVLSGAAGWLGVELTDTGSTLGWSRIFRGRCAHVEINPADAGALAHLRGRYRELGE
jgi:flavin reductase (DIM6/NTAB) family NADH-FMN oxidoreductase RutF